MNSLSISRLQEIPGFKQLLTLIGLAAAIAGGIFLFSWTQTPTFAPLYTGLEDKDAAEVTEALRAAGVLYQLDAVTGAITVPATQLHEAKLKLAAQGLPQGGRSGVEQIERDQGFGVSQFVENARYQHALETELVRTISTMRQVRNARVHLALPKPTAFTRSRMPATASVLLELYSGRTLDPSQVAAIVHLVGSSIPDLSSEKVTVVDQYGRLLTTNSSSGELAEAASQFEQIRRVEESYMQRIEQLLLPMTGPNRVSAQVNVDMDFSVVEEARESFTPDPNKVRSEKLSETTSQSGAGSASGAGAAGGAGANAEGVPGSLTNTPPTESSVASAGKSSNSNQTNSQMSSSKNFELDRTVSHTKQQPARLRRVSAAVLVDHIPKADAEGKMVTAALTVEQVTQIEALIKQAIGFSEARGDSVSVMSSAFASSGEAVSESEMPMWQQPWLMEVMRYGVGAIALIVLLLAVVRPTVRSLLDSKDPPQLGADEAAHTLRQALPDLNAAARAEISHRQANEMSGADQERLEQTVLFETKLAGARAAVKDDPKRVAQVVKEWVAEDA